MQNAYWSMEPVYFASEFWPEMQSSRLVMTCTVIKSLITSDRMHLGSSSCFFPSRFHGQTWSQLACLQFFVPRVEREERKNLDVTYILRLAQKTTRSPIHVLLIRSWREEAGRRSDVRFLKLVQTKSSQHLDREHFPMSTTSGAVATTHLLLRAV
jgi:hypothetical protein